MRCSMLSFLAMAAFLTASPVSADPFTANGYIVDDFFGCQVFWDVETARGALKLDDFGGFSQGDYVTVTGDVEYCSSGCQYIYECVQVSSITVWPPNFQGCGTIIETEICQYFRADNGRTYQLFDYGGFGTGDEIYVTGHIRYDYADFCLEGVEEAAIMDTQIIPCAASSVEGPSRAPVRWSTVKATFR